MIKIHSISIFCIIFLLAMMGPSYAAPFVNNHNGTVTDSKTGLMWQKEDDGVERSWNEAVKYCESLDLAGYNNWILPKVYMLEALVDLAYSPTVNPAFIVKPSYYWSSSVSRNSDKSAKYINFYYGNTYTYSKDNSYYVICVREADLSNSNPLRASFSADFNGELPLNVRFEAEITGGSEPYFYEWDFGDGDSSSLSSPSHDFMNSGTYKIVLTVSDNDGAITDASHDITLPFKKEEDLSLLSSDSSQILKEQGQEDNAIGSESNAASSDALTLVKPQGEGSEASADLMSDSLVPAGEINLQQDFSLGQKNPDLNTAQGDAGSAGQILPDSGSAGIEKISDNIPVQHEQPETGFGESTPAALPVINEQVDPSSMESQAVSLVDGPTPSLNTAYDFKPARMEVFSGIGDEAGASSQNSLLAYSFENALKGDADWNKDATVTAFELNGYLSIAIQSLSGGQQKPVVVQTGKDFSICSEKGSTYILTIGSGLQNTDMGAGTVSTNAEIVRQAIAGRCQSSKTSILTGERATRAEILRALSQISSMIESHDHLVFYFDGKSEVIRGRLNLYASDTVKENSLFSGLFYDDLIWFIETMKAANVTVLLEAAPY